MLLQWTALPFFSTFSLLHTSNNGPSTGNQPPSGQKRSALALNLKRIPLILIDPASISSAARTISFAFSPDPLIQWLRPNAIPWSQQSPAVRKWQYRRVQRTILDGLVFQSQPIWQMLQLFQSKSSEPKGDCTTLGSVSEDKGSDSGAVVFLHPPRSQWRWSLARIFLACELWVLDWLSPVLDTDTPAKVSAARPRDSWMLTAQRHEKLSNAHDASVRLLSSKHQLNDPWYLEAVAVHPSLQSRGLGGKTLRWILEYIGDSPIFLECTRRDNIGFYESFGFQVAEEVELVDDEGPRSTGGVRYWVMVRK